MKLKDYIKLHIDKDGMLDREAAYIFIFAISSVLNACLSKLFNEDFGDLNGKEKINNSN